MSILNELKKKVKPGESVYYMDKNNDLDRKTVMDTKNEFEKFIKNKKNWHDILEAIYDENGTSYVAAPKKGSKTEFSVIDTKKTSNPSFEVEMLIKDNALVLENLMDKKKTTMIEMGAVLDSTRDTPTAEKQVEKLMDNLKDYKNKPPKVLKAYLESVVDTIK